MIVLPAWRLITDSDFVQLADRQSCLLSQMLPYLQFLIGMIHGRAVRKGSLVNGEALFWYHHN